MTDDPATCAAHGGPLARCASCGKSFCAACEATSTPAAVHPVCRDCAYRTLGAAADGHAREHERAERELLVVDPERRRRRRIAVELVLLAALAFFAIRSRPGPALAHGAAGVPPAAGARGYAECVENMWKIREAIADAVRARKRPPAALDELPLALRCPAEGKAYDYSAAADGRFYLACPGPALHGVRAIESGPASRAPVVTP